jgi:hypothetical protein
MCNHRIIFSEPGASHGVPLAKMERPAPAPPRVTRERLDHLDTMVRSHCTPESLSFEDTERLSPLELTLADLDLLSTLVLQKLNSMLARGVYNPMELLEVDPGDFHTVHRQEAARLQRLGERLWRLSLNA